MTDAAAMVVRGPARLPPGLGPREVFYARLQAMGRSTGPFDAQAIVHRPVEYGVIATPGLSKRHEATVLSGEWLVIDADGAYLNYCVAPPHPAHSAYILPGGVVHPAVSQRLEAAVLVGGGTNYCHWLFDFLPRVLALPAALHAVPWIVNARPLPFQVQSLQALGIAPAQWHGMDYPAACVVGTLVMVDLDSCCTQPSFRPEVIAQVRAAFKPLFSPAAPHRRLWVSRAAQAHARLVNAAQAEALARRHGFEVVHLEHLSFAEQVRLFSEAAIVAGPHGAGFANLAFAPPGTHLIELMSAEFARAYDPRTMFSRLAQVLGQRAERLTGTAVGTCDAHLVNLRYHVDPQALDAALARAVRAADGAPAAA